MAAPHEVVSIDVWELRRLFNEGRYLERLKLGEFTARVRRRGHPSPPRANEPLCTWSMTIVYLDQHDRPVALVHEYRRKDGTRGASGQPDPKWLLHNGIVYVPEATM